MIEKFAAYLRDVHRIQERFIPFYLKWVKESCLHTKTPLKVPIKEDAKDAYLVYSYNCREDWQLKQADESIRLYTHFLLVADILDGFSISSKQNAMTFHQERLPDSTRAIARS